MKVMQIIHKKSKCAHKTYFTLCNMLMWSANMQIVVEDVVLTSDLRKFAKCIVA